MPISSDSPVVVPPIPAQPEKTYGLWWMRRLVIEAPSPVLAVSVESDFCRMHCDENGCDLLATAPTTFFEGNLFEEKAEDVFLMEAIGQVFLAVFGQNPPEGLTKVQAIEFVVGCLGAVAKVRGSIV